MQLKTIGQPWLAALVLLAGVHMLALTPTPTDPAGSRGPAYREAPSPAPPVALASQEEGQGPEANLPFLFAVYTVTWVLFFGYAFYLSRRPVELRREIAALRQELEQRKGQGGQ